MMHVLVTGTHRLTGAEREWAERSIETRLDKFEPFDTTFYGGDAWGVDYAAERHAKRRAWFERRIFPAQWSKYGKAAGIKRNATMLTKLLYVGEQHDEAIVLAFLPKGHWTNGTKDMVKRAINVGVRVEVWIPTSASVDKLVSELDSELDTGSVMFLTSY